MSTKPQKKPLEPVLTWGFEDENEEDLSIFWDDLCINLQGYMKQLNPTFKWHAVVENFGWQKLNGTKNFDSDKGRNFLSQILPKTENKFKIFIVGKGYGRHFVIQNFHHDNSDGSEIYRIYRFNAKKH